MNVFVTILLEHSLNLVMFCCAAFISVLIAIGIALYYYLNQWYRKPFIDDFQDMHVFITGTDSGFGHKLALELDSKGVSVYAGCYTERGVDELHKKASKKLKTLRVDVTDVKSINEAKDFIEKDLPAGKGLWGLVNNAGIIGNMCFDFSPIEEYRELMEVNYFGHIQVIQKFLPLIKKARGRIATVISIFGRGNVGVAPYCCSKYALEPYCDALRRSMKTFGVHAAIIEPGYFQETGLVSGKVIMDGFQKQWDKLSDITKKEYGEEFKENFVERTEQSFSRWPLVNYNHPNMVTDAMQHALGAKRPKARYLCGYDARLYVLFTNIVPDWFLDVIVRHVGAYNKVAAKV